MSVQLNFLLFVSCLLFIINLLSQLPGKVFSYDIESYFATVTRYANLLYLYTTQSPVG